MAVDKRPHWTEKSIDDFLYKISADFVRQIESAMEASGVNQAALAKRLHVTEGRVSQVLNNPGNLTLKKVVEYVRALGRKVAIVEYSDSDPENRKGPINSEIFATCWRMAGAPSDFFALEDTAANKMTYVLGPSELYNFPPLNIGKRAANNETMPVGENRPAVGTADIDIKQPAVANNHG